LGGEIERLNSSLMDTETRLKQESASVKSRLASEVQQLQQTLDDQTRTGDELRAAVKRQARQVSELQSHLEHMERGYQGALDELQAVQRKALAVCNEVDTMRSSLDRH
jgi:chromosome segregation ATPase